MNSPHGWMVARIAEREAEGTLPVPLALPVVPGPQKQKQRREEPLRDLAGKAPEPTDRGGTCDIAARRADGVLQWAPGEVPGSLARGEETLLSFLSSGADIRSTLSGLVAAEPGEAPLRLGFDAFPNSILWRGPHTPALQAYMYFHRRRSSPVLQWLSLPAEACRCSARWRATVLCSG